MHTLGTSVASLAAPAGLGLGVQLRSRARAGLSGSRARTSQRGGRVTLLAVKNQQGNGSATAERVEEAKPAAGVVGLKLSSVFNEVLAEEIANQGEGSVQKIYGPNEWQNHKRVYRYVRHLQNLGGSKKARNILPPVFSSFMLSLGVGCYATVAAMNPDLDLPQPVGAGYPVIALGTSVLSFLLVFRTNNSYGRFDEGRKLWGGLVNRSRDMVRQCVAFFPQDERGFAAAQAIARWVPAFTHCLRVHLGRTPGEDLRVLDGWLHPHELKALTNAKHRPHFCLQMIGEVIRLNVREHNSAVFLDENVRYFEDVLGACERIYRTPIPVSYTRHTSRFLSIWAMVVPFCFWHEVKWTALLFAPLLTFLLFAIDEIGVQLEEPFGVMPLVQICERIRLDCQEIMVQTGETKQMAQDIYLSAKW